MLHAHQGRQIGDEFYPSKPKEYNAHLAWEQGIGKAVGIYRAVRETLRSQPIVGDDLENLLDVVREELTEQNHHDFSTYQDAHPLLTYVEIFREALNEAEREEIQHRASRDQLSLFAS